MANRRYALINKTAESGASVDDFNGRTGSVVPQQSDYDSFFLTPAEGDTAYYTQAAADAEFLNESDGDSLYLRLDESNDNNIWARLADNETISGLWVFENRFVADQNPSSSGPTILARGATSASVGFEEEDAAADNGIWDILATEEGLRFRVVNDARSSAVNFMAIGRTGTNIDTMSLEADTTTAFGELRVAGGNNFRVYDSTSTDYINFSHDGSAGIINLITSSQMVWQFDGDEKFSIDSSNSRVNIQDGWTLRIRDSANTSFLDVAHDGTDITMSGTGTTDINIAGLGNLFWLRDGARYRVSDSTNTDYVQWAHNGTDGIIDVTNANQLAFRFDGSNIFALEDSNSAVNLRSGWELRVSDSDNSDQVSLAHDGNEAIFDLTNSGHDYRFDVNGTPVFRLVGQTAAEVRQGSVFRVFDSGNTDSLGIDVDGTDATITGTNVTDLNITGFDRVQLEDSTLSIKEASAAASNVAGYGQVYVLDTTPNELWFEDDAGNTHHVAGGQLTEVFGATKDTEETVTSSTTLQDDDELFLDVKNGFTYLFVMSLEVAASSTTPDVKWSFDVPSGSTGFYESVSYPDSSASSTSIVEDFTDTVVAVIDLTGSTKIFFRGIFTAGADGTFQLQWAQRVSSGTPTRMLVGGKLVLTRVS